MAEPILSYERFGYRYPGAESHAIRAVDLEIAAGEFVLLAGRSASGKTTLMRAGCGLVPRFHGGVAEGRVVVCGLDTREHGVGTIAAQAGYVAQDPESQVVSTTVAAELELPLDLRGAPEASRGRAVEEVALALAIPHLLERTVESLSGGELQRVALAAALVPRPRLVFLDEPTSQLDPVAGDELISLLRRLNEEWGTTIVLSEHRLERCLGAADRVLVVDGGTLEFDGDPSAFLAWTLERDPTLCTPGGRLFAGAGLDPLPVSVKEARSALAARGLAPVAEAPYGPGVPARGRRRPGRGSRAGLALELRDLWVERDSGDGIRDVLRGIDLDLHPGERVALMGRNGAGKSTMLAAAAGLIAPVRGSVAAPRGHALLTQVPGDLLVHERVSSELRPEAAGALDEVGLAGRAEADPRDLSGGERQRLALAVVLAGRGLGGGAPPGAVLLDEPTRGMDRAHKEWLTGLVERLALAGAGVVVATHDVEFAAEFAQRVVMLGNGEVVADGSASEVLAGGWYFSTEVARILGAGGAILPADGAALIEREIQRVESS